MCETNEHGDALLKMACDMAPNAEARYHIRQARQHFRRKEVTDVE